MYIDHITKKFLISLLKFYKYQYIYIYLKGKKKKKEGKSKLMRRCVLTLEIPWLNAIEIDIANDIKIDALASNLPREIVPD